MSDVGRFFDRVSDDYTETIERCFPRYREMLWALVDYLPVDPEIESIVELGCGTGNLSVLLSAAFPKATLRLVDLSQESLQVCQQRLGHDRRFVFDNVDFGNLELPGQSADLVISSIAIHHLRADGKRKLFRRIHEGLRPHGVFAYADQFRGASDSLYARHMLHWKTQSMAAGSHEREFQMWMDHQHEFDFHDTLKDQLDWLSIAGFETVDCVWRYLLWSVVQAAQR